MQRTQHHASSFAENLSDAVERVEGGNELFNEFVLLGKLEDFGDVDEHFFKLFSCSVVVHVFPQDDGEWVVGHVEELLGRAPDAFCDAALVQLSLDKHGLCMKLVV